MIFFLCVYIALLILVEYTFLSFLALYAFGSKIEVSSNVENTSFEGVAAVGEDDVLNISWCEFLADIFRLTDTNDGLALASPQLTERLLQNSKDELVN